MKDDHPIRTLMKCLGLNAALMLRAVWPKQAPQRDALAAAGVAARRYPHDSFGR
jgi:hypothetical protein